MSRRAKLLALTLAMLGFLGVATPAQAANQMYSGSLIIEAFGNDTGPPPYFLGIPLGARCNTRFGGNVCFTATLQQGAPLTGSGSLSDTTPPGATARGFTLPASGLAAQVSGSLPFSPYAPSYNYTFADLRNQAGSFQHGGGPGSFSFVYTAPNRVATAAVKAGPNQFGGVMRLLGTQQSRWRIIGPVFPFVFSPNWLFDLIGESGTGVTRGMTSPLSYSFTVNATAFPWTTGTASVALSFLGSPLYVQQRQGYDNRTPTSGRGTIQLVSPLLTHWRLPQLRFDTPAIGILRIALPEPEQWLMLVAGLGLLGVLCRARPR